MLLYTGSAVVLLYTGSAVVLLYTGSAVVLLYTGSAVVYVLCTHTYLVLAPSRVFNSVSENVDNY